MSNKRGDNNSFSKMYKPTAVYSIKPVPLANIAHQQAQPSTANDSYTMSNAEIDHALASLEDCKNNPESAMDYKDFKKWLEKSLTLPS